MTWLYPALLILLVSGETLSMPDPRALEGAEADRLLGGYPLENFSDFPFYVIVKGHYWFGGSYRCPTFLYDPLTLVTSAQCAMSSYGISYLRAYCGDQTRYIKHSQMHENVNFWSSGPNETFAPNDIAVMHLYQPFTIDDQCQLAKLPQRTDEDFSYACVDIIGFNTNESESSHPMIVEDLRILPPDECYSFFGNNYDPDMHICIKDPNEEQAACFNDHSSPAFMIDFTIVGLGSWIYSACEEGDFFYPSVYVNVAHFLDWIEEHKGVPSNE